MMQLHLTPAKRLTSKGYHTSFSLERYVQLRLDKIEKGFVE